MATQMFRLLVGDHVQDDYSQPADENGRRPSKTYKAPAVFESERDLVEWGGAGKFAYADPHQRGRFEPGFAPNEGGSPVPPPHKSSVAPAGQVTTGNQYSTVMPDGRTFSGPLDQVVAQQEATLSQQEFEASQGLDVPHPSLTPLPNLQAMNLKQLNELAERNEVETKGSKDRNEIIRLIQADYKKAQAAHAAAYPGRGPVGSPASSPGHVQGRPGHAPNAPAGASPRPGAGSHPTPSTRATPGASPQKGTMEKGTEDGGSQGDD